MSVSTLPAILSEKLDITKQSPVHAKTLNNNISSQKIFEECKNVENDSKSFDELTDDTASDSQSADAVYSESSGALYGSDDIIFEDEITFAGNLERSNSVDFLKEKAIELLQQELKTARKELKVKDEVCKELKDVRTKVEAELEELTASLFEEAHKMVREANLKEYRTDKKLTEAKGEIEALQTEVSALKSLVLTSTPSSPNPQLHPQLIKKKKDILSSPIRKHRRNRSNAETSTLQKPEHAKQTKPILKMAKEIDLVIMGQLDDWLKTISHAPPLAVNQSKTDQSTSVSNQNADVDVNDSEYEEKITPVTSQLLQRIEEEDISPCLTFPCAAFSAKVAEYVRENTLTIEPLVKPVQQRCALSGSTICCKHRIKCGEDGEWFPISQSSRTRIASVCDFLTYIRYIKQGLVKHSREQIYWEMNRLRREMALAKLGYYKEE